MRVKELIDTLYEALARAEGNDPEVEFWLGEHVLCELEDISQYEMNPDVLIVVRIIQD